jgi:putative toxin-antitoxin system antitoxin component (TIGR02293 family)
MSYIKNSKKRKTGQQVYPSGAKASVTLGEKKAPEYKISRNGIVQHYIQNANALAGMSHSSGALGGGIINEPMQLAEAYEELSPANMVRTVDAGLAVGELDVLREALGWSMERLAPKVGLSMATFHRRKLGGLGRLTTDESDKVIRYARLLAKAIEVLGTEDDARRWLNAAQFGLGGAAPLDYAATEVGAREVEDLLGRIDYGVYS